MPLSMPASATTPLGRRLRMALLEMAQRVGIGFVHDRTDEGPVALPLGTLDVRLRVARGEPCAQLPERRLQILDLALQFARRARAARRA